MKWGIACASGSAKGIFVHGVLSAFEHSGMIADMYAASSSSSIPAAFAAIHQLDALHAAEYWKGVRSRYADHGYDMSAAVKDGIAKVLPALDGALFGDAASRFAVAVNEVVNDQAAELTQGEGARRLGKRLMLSIRQRDSSWAKENLSLRMFDNRAEGSELQLEPTNLSDVLYATTRMLHSWKDAGWIDGRPFIDASYTCVTPAIELAEMGFEDVVVISPETGPIYRDFFQSEMIPEVWLGSRIHVVQPPSNLADIGVDYLNATDEGLDAAYELGGQIGESFLKSFRR